jgi:hypothetical protein
MTRDVFPGNEVTLSLMTIMDFELQRGFAGVGYGQC